MMITYENYNAIENPNMGMEMDDTIRFRAEAIIAEGHDEATAIENALTDEHYGFIHALEKIERGQYDDVECVFAYYDKEDGDVYTDIDDNVFTAEHVAVLEDKLYYAVIDDYVGRKEYEWEGDR